MDCDILRTLYLKSNGEVLCNDDAGEQVRLGAIEPQRPGWSIEALLDGEPYRQIRQAFSADQVPWEGICERCAFLRRGLPMDDALSARTIPRLQLEPSLACNLRCLDCSNPAQRRERKPPHVMPLETFEAVLRSLRDARYRVECLEYCGQGEPLTNARFWQFVEVARELMPHTRQRLITNGNFDYGETLRGQALDEIYVACDGLYQESYEQYRKKGRVDRALRFMEDVPARLGGRRQQLVWKYILFQFNDDREELIEAQRTAEQLGVDTLQFTVTQSECRSRAFTIDNLATLPIVSDHTVIEPCPGHHEGMRYGRRRRTTFLPPHERRHPLLGRWWQPRRTFHAHLDEVICFAGGVLALRGWAAARQRLSHVRILCDGEIVGRAELARDREDVLCAFPQFHRQRCGFYLCRPAPKLPASRAEIAVELWDGPDAVGRMVEQYSFA